MAQHVPSASSPSSHSSAQRLIAQSLISPLKNDYSVLDSIEEDQGEQDRQGDYLPSSPQSHLASHSTQHDRSEARNRASAAFAAKAGAQPLQRRPALTVGSPIHLPPPSCLWPASNTGSGIRVAQQITAQASVARPPQPPHYSPCPPPRAVIKGEDNPAMTVCNEGHPQASDEVAARPRASSGLTVADLLASPSQSKRPKARSLEGPPVSHAASGQRPQTAASSPRQPSNPETAGVHSKASSPYSRSQSPSVPGTGMATPSKAPPSASGVISAALADSPSEVPAYQYASIQQIVEDRENIEYILDIREQPKQSRMCGVGEKADRRPIDPAPIIQLRVITHPHAIRGPHSTAANKDEGQKILNNIASDLSTSVVRPRTVQGQKESDPSLPQLRRGAPVVTQYGQGWEDKAWYLENPYYFMCAMLSDAERDEELHLLSDGKTRYTTGSCVSCLYHLKDIDGSHQGFFVFPDLSIRIEGRYRLKLCLFETIGNEVHHCKSIYSSPFMVYTAKRFPGMEESTRLSRTFADQGLKVRVRKNPRGKRSKREKSAGGPNASEDDDEGYSQSRESAAMALGVSHPKRLRSDSWLSAGSSDYPLVSGYVPAAYRQQQTPSPISPQGQWSNGQGTFVKKSQAAPNLDAWHNSPASVQSGSHRHVSTVHRVLNHDPRRQTSSVGEESRPVRHQGNVFLGSGATLREASWPPINPMLPPPSQASHRAAAGPIPPSVSLSSSGPPCSRRASPTGISSAYAVNRPNIANSLAPMSSLTSRQRSASSAASFSPRPWEARSLTASSNGPEEAALSRSYSGVHVHSAGAGSRAHQPSQHAGHHRERSLSDPRNTTTAASLRPGRDTTSRLSHQQIAARPVHDRRPTLPPITSGSTVAVPRSCGHGRSAYHYLTQNMEHAGSTAHHGPGAPHRSIPTAEPLAVYPAQRREGQPPVSKFADGHDHPGFHPSHTHHVQHAYSPSHPHPHPQTQPPLLSSPQSQSQSHPLPLPHQHPRYHLQHQQSFEQELSRYRRYS